MTDTSATPQERANEPWRLLGTLPSTNWKMVSSTGLIWVVTLFLCALIWNVRVRDAVVTGLVDSLLMFVATVGGVVPAAMFATKRWSFKPGGPDDKRSDAANPPAAAPVSDGVAAPAAPAQPVAPVPPVPPPVGF
jgi:hypothetical protein